MFVCLGNICRSPAAHAVLESRISTAGLNNLISVESSGTDAYHVGENADSRMCRTAGNHGVRINHKSQRFSVSDFDRYDMIIAMDQQNYRTLQSFSRGIDDESKIVSFRDFDPIGPGDVPDPWYGGPEGFERVWDILDRTSDVILDRISSNLEL